MSVTPEPRSRFVSDLAAELVAGGPALDDAGRRLAVALYRLLAQGDPAAPAALAMRLAVPEGDVVERLDALPGVYRDERGAVIGFWGLALGETPHQMIVDGRTLYTWCAWDALFIPPILERRASVESACAVTGEPITLTVTPHGVEDVAPAGAVLSLLRPGEGFGDDVISSFCHRILFFGSRFTGVAWTENHPGTFLLTPDEGFELGRLVWGDRFRRADW